MWNIQRSLGQITPIMVPLKTQKRDFASLNLSNVDIMPGKLFRNPNFVNNHYPNVHYSHSSNPVLIPISNNINNKSDISGTVTEKPYIQDFINSSQNTVESTKEIPCENHKKFVVENSPMCYSRKRCKKVRRNRKNKVPNKNSKQNNSLRQICDMMEVDLEPEILVNCDKMITSPPKSLNLTDFIINASDTPTKSTKLDDSITVVSISPQDINKMCPRERELSICESEDSFIIFDSGTDEELEFSDSDDLTELDSEDEYDSGSEIDDDFDSSCSVVPCKRVRFAKKELCEIHPMVQWSFAYRKARKGPWEEYARDRERFNKRISHTEVILGPIFDKQHRENVYKERFKENIG